MEILYLCLYWTWSKFCAVFLFFAEQQIVGFSLSIYFTSHVGSWFFSICVMKWLQTFIKGESWCSGTDRGCLLLAIVSDLCLHYLIGNSAVEVTGWLLFYLSLMGWGFENEKKKKCLWDRELMLLFGWRYLRRGGWALETCRSCQHRATDILQRDHCGSLSWSLWFVRHWSGLTFFHLDAMLLVTYSLPVFAVLLSNGFHLLLPDYSLIMSLRLALLLGIFWRHHFGQRTPKLHLCSWLQAHCLSKSCGRNSSL